MLFPRVSRIEFFNTRFVRINLVAISATLLGFGAVISAAHAAEAPAAEAFALKSGDRVLFYGDSITEQNLYNSYVETFVITRFPDLEVTFAHAGWGGDSVNGGGGGPIDQRLDRDVFPYKPTVLTIMLGMNDGRYHAFSDEIFQTYARGYEHIVERVHENLPKTRTYLIQPSPYDDVTRPPLFPGGYNQVLLRFGSFVKELAARNNLQTVDFNEPFVRALERAKTLNSDLAPKLINDRVHPDPSGQLFMAAALLEAWGAPKTVTAVKIDRQNKTIVEAENTTVSDLAIAEEVTWTQTDRALPFPINLTDPAIALADQSADLTSRLSQEILTISGLADGNYELRIDGQSIGSLKAERLSQGVNLSLFDTPMRRRAFQIHQLSLRHNRLHYVNWRSAQLGVGEIKSKEVTELLGQLVDEMNREENEMVMKQHELARPVAHHFELRRAKN